MHTGIADVDRHICAFHLHAVFAGAHGIAAAVDGITEFERKSGVAAGAVDDGAGHTAARGHPGEDIAPNGGILASAVIENHHSAGRDLVNVIADRARRLAGGTVEDRIGAAGEPELWIERLDSEALAGNAEPVHGVAESSRIELGSAL